MKTTEYIPEIEKSCVALGFFDGIHTAHAAVITAAFGGDGEKIVLSVGAKEHGAGAIITEEETAVQLEALGADVHLTPEFSAIKDLSGEQFVDEIIARRLHAGRVACGFNYRFGAGASCGAAELERLCSARNIECVVVPAVEMNGEVVSSTAIRAALSDGDVEKAAAMLGRRYGYTLPVVEGQHLGRRLGAPTINQKMPEGLFLPRFGVYASVTRVDGRDYASITNIGVRPTVGSDCPVSETMIDGFSGDLYGRSVRVELSRFVRPERKFASVDELEAQIAADMASVFGSSGQKT